MGRLLIKFFPSKSTFVYLALTAGAVFLARDEEDALAVIAIFSFAVGLLCLMFYYLIVNHQLTVAVSESLILGFISNRPYAHESDSSREEIWENLARDANMVVEKEFHVKGLFTAKTIEQRLDTILASPEMQSNSEVTGWNKVKLAAKNIRAQDMESFWARKIPSGVLDRYGVLGERNILDYSTPDKV